MRRLSFPLPAVIWFAALLALPFIWFATALSASPPHQAADQDGTPAPDQPVVVDIRADRDGRQWLADSGYDIWSVDPKDSLVTVALLPEEWRELAARGMSLTLNEERTRDLDRVNPFTFYGGYSTVEELYALYDQIVSEHPHLAQLVDYGDSWEKVTAGSAPGYDLHALRLTNREISGTVPAPGLDNRPDIVITKPVFFLMADIHARELTTAETARRFLLQLVEGYGVEPDITWILDHHEVWIVLTANPDGYKVVENQGGSPLLHRKNTNNANGGSCNIPPTYDNQYGTDLNRNASFKWNSGGSSSHPCSQTFHGPYAASEPEQQALELLMGALFTDQRGPADSDAAPLDRSGTMISLHSYADLVLWPWGWTDADAPNHVQLARLGRKLASYNGHTAQQSVELYATSGTTDEWAYGVLGVASFTFEIGPGYGPCGGFQPPFACQDEFWAENGPALLYAARTARAPYTLPAGPDVRALTGSEVVEAGALLTLAGIVDSSAGSNLPISEAIYWIDLPGWVDGATALSMSAADGSFDSSIESVAATIETDGLLGGRHTLFVQGRDSAGNWGPVSARFFYITPTDPGGSLYLPLAGR